MMSELGYRRGGHTEPFHYPAIRESTLLNFAGCILFAVYGVAQLFAAFWEFLSAD